MSLYIPLSFFHPAFDACGSKIGKGILFFYNRIEKGRKEDEADDLSSSGNDER